MTTNNVEQRAVSLIQCRLNDLNDASRTFEGYGNVFNIVDSHGTSFAPGCFAESLAQWKSQKRLPFMFLMRHQLLTSSGVMTVSISIIYLSDIGRAGFVGPLFRC